MFSRDIRHMCVAGNNNNKLETRVRYIKPLRLGMAVGVHLLVQCALYMSYVLVSLVSLLLLLVCFCLLYLCTVFRSV